MKRLLSALVISLAVISPSLLSAAQDDGESEMKVRRVTLDPYSKNPVVLLETIRDRRLLPIWIGIPEAQSIALELENVDAPRPLTHDLIRNIIRGIGARLQRIVISDLKENTYFAILIVKLGSREYRIDSRPSDAIAVALRMKAPIFASARVLAKAKPLSPAEESGDELRDTLGIDGQDLTPDLIRLLEVDIQRGVLVAGVTPGGPAARAGIGPGDIITKAGRRPIDKVTDLASFLHDTGTRAREPIPLEVIKKGKPTTLVIDLPS